MAALLASESIAERRDAFVDRLLQASAGAFEIFTLYIGDRLGLYEAMASGKEMTPGDLSRATGTDERYAREWLEQQAVIGIIEARQTSAGEWLFRLPAAHAEVLADSESENYLAPLAQLLVGAASPMEKLLSAFRTGGGVPFREYGPDARQGQARINRVMYLRELPSDWIPAMPDVHERLAATNGARVADIGCGAGWSAIGMALGYPGVQVDGYDLDAPSIEMARENARVSGVEDRVRFHCRDAGDSGLDGHYHLVTAFECVHDMSDPVSVLSTMRRLAGDDGAVLVVDERVGESFSPAGNDIDWMMYGWSVLHCLPVGMSESPSACTGTVMRPSTLRGYALDAGFNSVEILPVENFFFRLYRLHP